MDKLGRIAPLLVFSIFSVAAGAQGAAWYDRDKAMAGEILVEPYDRGGAKGIKMAFAMDASRDYVWRMLTNAAGFHDLYQECDSATALSSDRHSAVIQYVITVLFRKYHYTLDFAYDPEGYRMDWSKAAGDFDRIDGFWEILPADREGRSLVTTESLVDLGFPIPAWIETWIKMVKSKEMVASFRKYAHEHP
jgi:hypothetical protein